MDETPITIAEIGSALYGAQWQTELARTLGVTDRTVRRWAVGKGVPRDIELVLAQLAKARAKQLREWARYLEVARLPNKKGNGILGGDTEAPRSFGPRKLPPRELEYRRQMKSDRAHAAKEGISLSELWDREQEKDDREQAAKEGISVNQVVKRREEEEDRPIVITNALDS